MRSRGWGGDAGQRRKLGRGWRRLFAALAVLVMAFSVATARLLVWPATGMPARVSAIVMLAGLAVLTTLRCARRS